MSGSIPASIKGAITSYIKRAEELERDTSNPDSGIVAYCCRLYGVTKAAKMVGNPPDPAVNSFLLSQMTILEQMKPNLTLGADKGKAVCENFVKQTFDMADAEDRSGAADKTTAKLFYSAATFYDVLEQFGEIDVETSERRKYAKWKATDILNAIREGRQPTAGGFGEDPTVRCVQTMGRMAP